MEIPEILLTIFSFLLVLAGGLGVILPFLPGVPIAWLGLLLFAYLTGFLLVTWKALLIFLGLVILSMAMDVIGPLVGAKKYQASRYGLIGLSAGTLLGLVLLGPIGIVVGPFLGAILGEMASGKEWEEALKSAKGVFLGILAGTAVKLALIIIIFGFMIFSLFSYFLL